jgi:MEDS: MEthanogen/methylotroph, DcmR Sensory domain
MDPADDKVTSHGKALREGSSAIRLGGSVLGHPCHACAFFNNHDDEHRVLLPFIKDGLKYGEKAVHTVDPDRRDDHLRQIAEVGINITATRQSGQVPMIIIGGILQENPFFVSPDKLLRELQQRRTPY